MEDKIEKLLEKRSQDIGKEWKDFAFYNISKCESVIEKLFLIEWEYGTAFASDFENFCIIPQYKTNNYRVDFMVYYIPPEIHPIKFKEYLLNNRESCLIVEIDSHLWHGTDPEQFANEKERERGLQREGYKIMRFSGREIFRNVEKCVNEVLEYLMDIEDKDFEKKLEELEKEK